MHLRELDANLIVILDALLLEASVTKAAERLGRSPSAVSHALARLRDIFGDPLFVRAGQRLVPTSRATQLAPTVHIIVSGLEGLLRRVDGFDPREQQRRFDLACREVFELTLLPALRAELADLAPGITLERRHENDSTVVEALRAGRVQFAIVENAADGAANDVSSEKLSEDPYIFLAAAGHAMAGTLLSEKHLDAGGPPVIVDDMQAQRMFDAPGRPRPKNLETVASPLIAIHTALERNAIALAPESIAAFAQRHTHLKALETDLDPPSAHVHLMWHLSMERDECHAWMRDRFRWHCRASRETEGTETHTAVPA